MTTKVEDEGRPEFLLGTRGPAELAAWQVTAGETPLEPDLAIIDAHHHLWARRPYPFGHKDFLSDVGSELNLRATVHVECSSGYRRDGPVVLRPVGETEYVVRECAEGTTGPGPRVAAGIVGFADLCLGAAVRDVLEAHIAAGRGRFRGVRVRTMRDEWLHGSRQPPPGALGDARFRQGFGQLAPLGLTYDALLYSHQINELVDLARACPGTTLVLDHAGGVLGVGPWSGSRAAVLGRWQQAIRPLAQLPNVCVKIGGLGMPSCGFGFGSGARPPDSLQLCAAWSPYIDACVEAFGVSRCMFESNFPVDKQSCGYVALWNAFKRATAGWAPAERAALFHDTANRVYGLGA